MIQRVYQKHYVLRYLVDETLKIGVTETDELHVCSCTFVNVYEGIVEILLSMVFRCALCFGSWIGFRAGSFDPRLELGNYFIASSGDVVVFYSHSYITVPFFFSFFI